MTIVLSASISAGSVFGLVDFDVVVMSIAIDSGSDFAQSFW